MRSLAMDFCGNVVLLGISYCCFCCCCCCRNNVDYHQKLTTSSTVNGLGCHQDEVVSCSNCRQLRWLTLVSLLLSCATWREFPVCPTPHILCVCPPQQLFPLFLWLNAWPLLASRHFDVRWLRLGVSEAATARLSSPLHPRRPSEGFELHAVLGYF